MQVKAALIGKGIAASLTPAMHMQEGRMQGLSYNYALFDTATPEYAGLSLEALLVRAEASGCAGVNITYPFKQDVLGHLQSVDRQAREIGAVNTVVFTASGRVGYNTDYIGFRTAFASACADLPHRNVLLAGAGGAGRAVGLALLDEGVARLWVTDVDAAAAKMLVAHLASLRPAQEVLVWRGGAVPDGAVNATPMGMASHPGQALDLDVLRLAHWVSDIVYFPLQTALLRSARERGLATMTGGGMAVGQAVAAFQLFTGVPGNAERMAAHFARLTGQDRS